jgi:putative two-component system response regulator
MLADRYAVRGAPDCVIVEVSNRLCGELGVSVAERRRCLGAARLRDVGTIGVPPELLAKTAPLTVAERRIVQDHVRIGAELLAALPETRELAPIVAEHHERFDGSGYPAGLAATAISIEARIIAVAEAWCAAGGIAVPDAIQRVRARSGRELDPAVVAALARIVEAHAGGHQEGPHGLAA